MSTTSDVKTHEDVPPWAAGTEGRHHELNPELNDAQIEIIRGYGEERCFKAGEYLWNTGQRDAGFFLVLDGELDILRHDEQGEHAFITHGRGHYGGEIVTMLGRGALVAGRARTDLKVIAVQTTCLRRLIATEPELGEVLLLSFILRRMRMVAEKLGRIVIIGESQDRETSRVSSFLSRNGVPFEVVGPTQDAQRVSRLLDTHQADLSDLPVIIGNDGMLKCPTNREIADYLGISAEIDYEVIYDVVVVGAGPGGLAAAVYAASEGLNVVVIEGSAPGGQAGSSSRIENYLGFPTGISGQALAGRAFLQAQKFGANIAIARQVESFECGDPHVLTLDGGDRLKARTVVLATGAVYRQPALERLDTMGGVHYGASYFEGQLCHGKSVAVIGGGNSAGQAAVYLSRRASNVYILVRGQGLAASMSDYLVQRINHIPNIHLRCHTEVESILGEENVEGLMVQDNRDSSSTQLDVSFLFVFIGARPGTDFIEGQLALDDRGFVLTGDALSDDQLEKSGWDLDRRPYLLETSCPGVFAAGDVRSGSIKRVASAVGEGSVCVQFIHQVLNRG